MEKTFWDKRWQNNETGWDVGDISTPLKEYFDQIKNKDLKILIPGAGNSYEAEYLWKNGFKNVFVNDISALAIESFKKRIPDFPEDKILNRNFFDLKERFDLIIEQTFFCAIDPKMRNEYAKKTHELLNDNGKLVGLLFNRSFEGGPPFGGSKEEYQKTFEPYFNFKVFDTAYNSIKPRSGTELFINFEKK